MEVSVVSTDEGLDRLFAEEGPKLWRAVLAFTHDPTLASDAVAESFAQCLRRGDAIRDPRAWLWRASFRIAGRELKERGRWAPLPDDWEAPGGINGQPTELLASIGRLAPMQRATLILHHYAGFSTREIAAQLGIAQATVRVHLSRGRRRLTTILEEEDA
jgi:DNA-directed RNA polymerase specialized sigma24 family protein